MTAGSTICGALILARRKEYLDLQCPCGAKMIKGIKAARTSRDRDTPILCAACRKKTDGAKKRRAFVASVFGEMGGKKLAGG